MNSLISIAVCKRWDYRGTHTWTVRRSHCAEAAIVTCSSKVWGICSWFTITVEGDWEIPSVCVGIGCEESAVGVVGGGASLQDGHSYYLLLRAASSGCVLHVLCRPGRRWFPGFPDPGIGWEKRRFHQGGSCWCPSIFGQQPVNKCSPTGCWTWSSFSFW